MKHSPNSLNSLAIVFVVVVVVGGSEVYLGHWSTTTPDCLLGYRIVFKEKPKWNNCAGGPPKTKRKISNCAKSDARNLWHKPTKPNKLLEIKLNLVLFYLIICEETKRGKTQKKKLKKN